MKINGFVPHFLECIESCPPSDSLIIHFVASSHVTRLWMYNLRIEHTPKDSKFDTKCNSLCFYLK